MNDPVRISVRQESMNSGGTVVPVRKESGNLDGSGSVLMLIHGYNNSHEEALEAYGKFLSNLQQQFATQTAQVAEFFWPGDAPNKLVSTLSYPNQIQPAIDSAKELDVYLRGLPHAGPMVLNLVGHSLGCRVVLELLSRWAGAMPPNVSVGVVVLMAAAVVMKHVDTDGRLRNAALLTPKNPVLYSKGDQVLLWAFPIGETAAGEGFFPTAVGRAGGPPGTWHDPYPMSHDGEAYGHGSYWPGSESATAVAFALGGAPARLIADNAVIANPPPVSTAISSRSIPVRVLEARHAFA